MLLFHNEITMTAIIEPVEVKHIFLDLTNPRHVAYTSESEVIDYLCRSEHIYALAKDISRVGLNPLEAFALLPIDAKKRTRPNYTVAEGNRRLCAIKLLNDPDRAPAKLRRDFVKLAESSQTIFEVSAVVFEDRAQVDAWLERIHGGVQGGVGRKPWNAEQKTRHIGDKKNLLAQSVLDYAQQRDFISAEERKGKLTTAQRYLGNAFLREAVGLESTSLEDVSRNRPQEDFDQILKSFTRDLVEGTVNSRSNSEEIRRYARALSSLQGLTNKRVPPLHSLMRTA